MVEYLICKGKNGYGIKAVENGKTVNRVNALFETENEAYEFTQLCTVLALSPIHLEDVSEDILFVKKSR